MLPVSACGRSRHRTAGRQRNGCRHRQRRRLPQGRDFAAWLGLVPRQHSTGGKARLLGISKRGNPYLRKMFIHGGRAVVLRLKREGTTLGAWMNGLEARAAKKVLIVAVANKLARIAWAVLSSGEPYRSAAATA